MSLRNAAWRMCLRLAVRACRPSITASSLAAISESGEHLSRQDLPGARMHLEQALHYEPSCVSLYIAASNLERRANAYAHASVYISKALSVLPSPLAVTESSCGVGDPLLCLQALLDAEQGRRASARAAFRLLENRAKTPDFYLGVAVAKACATDSPAEALAALESAVAFEANLAPCSATAHTELVAALEAAGRREDARKVCLRGLAVQPDRSQLWIHLVELSPDRACAWQAVHRARSLGLISSSAAVRLAKQMPDAEEALELLTKIGKDRQDALLARVKLARKTGDYDEAMRIIHHLAEVMPRSGPVYTEWAALEKQKGDMERWERVLRVGAQKCAVWQRAPLYHELAMNAVKQGLFVAARRDLANALRMDPTHPHSLCSLAKLDMKMGRMDRARRLLEDGLARHPTNTHMLLSLAQLEKTQGSGHKALEACRKGILADPCNPLVMSELVKTLVELGNTDEALREFALFPGNNAAVQRVGMSLGVQLAKLRRFADVAEVLQRAVDVNPGPASVNARLTMARMLQIPDLPNPLLHQHAIDILPRNVVEAMSSNQKEQAYDLLNWHRQKLASRLKLDKRRASFFGSLEKSA